MLNPLARKISDDTPGALAAELADARVAFETTRANVIDRGCARRNAINEMMAELQLEQRNLTEVINDANGGSVDQPTEPFNYEDEPSLS